MLTEAPKNTKESKVVIGDPNKSIEVAIETLTCFNPEYQVNTYEKRNAEVISTHSI